MRRALGAAVLAMLLCAAAAPARPQDMPREGHFVVELVVKIGPWWYRLNSGPRDTDQARNLWQGMHEALAAQNVEHKFVIIDMDDGTAEVPDLFVAPEVLSKPR